MRHCLKRVLIRAFELDQYQHRGRAAVTSVMLPVFKPDLMAVMFVCRYEEHMYVVDRNREKLAFPVAFPLFCAPALQAGVYVRLLYSSSSTVLVLSSW
jgi:hypothetical protein